MNITDKVLDTALDAFDHVPPSECGATWGDDYRSDMRAALSAALSSYDEALEEALAFLEAQERLHQPRWDGTATPGSAIGILRSVLRSNQS